MRWLGARLPSLRARVALVGGLAVLVSLLAATLVLYPVADRDLHDQLDGSLVQASTSAPGLMSQLYGKAAKTGAILTAPPPVVTVGDEVIQFLDGSDRMGQATPLGPVTLAEEQVLVGKKGSVFETTQFKGRTYRMYTTTVGGPGEIVEVARPATAATAPLDRLRLLLVALILGAALVAMLTARLVAGRVLRPVRELTDKIERVTATGDLTIRMDTRGRDEIDRLARSFSAMMTALDRSVQAQRRLVADASHELRTPLTSLTTNLELLAEHGGLADPQAPRLLAAALEQGGELRMLINDLVELARYGEVEPHLEDVRLDLLAGHVVARAAKRAPHLDFEADLDDCLVYADPDAIERALGNLVDNAVKWSPDGGVVRVTVTAHRDVATVEVTDQGPGIPEKDLPYVFDRFYRSAAARAQPGWGLGLSIVRQIADTHSGQVSAHQRIPGPGTVMRLALPKASA
ncbi:HAMP domain-containing histidine kinase [Actinospica durhamensis]|uniref:histidine kinase n=1 Tax=Actinospica durhamensis TaxID=1508375 RepID=A0A941IR03_9ACTN|nr:HAMP domain-containing sensor histidine kinase [Actinospica durhamensis]MBR7833443.1 HAMP domain-containing histidine kinase [Actinospica durhamensis]